MEGVEVGFVLIGGVGGQEVGSAVVQGEADGKLALLVDLFLCALDLAN